MDERATAHEWETAWGEALRSVWHCRAMLQRAGSSEEELVAVLTAELFWACARRRAPTPRPSELVAYVRRFAKDRAIDLLRGRCGRREQNRRTEVDPESVYLARTDPGFERRELELTWSRVDDLLRSQYPGDKRFHEYLDQILDDEIQFSPVEEDRYRKRVRAACQRLGVGRGTMTILPLPLWRRVLRHVSSENLRSSKSPGAPSSGSPKLGRNGAAWTTAAVVALGLLMIPIAALVSLRRAPPRGRYDFPSASGSTSGAARAAAPSNSAAAVDSEPTADAEPSAAALGGPTDGVFLGAAVLWPKEVSATPSSWSVTGTAPLNVGEVRLYRDRSYDKAKRVDRTLLAVAAVTRGAFTVAIPGPTLRVGIQEEGGEVVVDEVAISIATSSTREEVLGRMWPDLPHAWTLYGRGSFPCDELTFYTVGIDWGGAPDYTGGAEFRATFGGDLLKVNVPTRVRDGRFITLGGEDPLRDGSFHRLRGGDRILVRCFPQSPKVAGDEIGAVSFPGP